MNPINHGGPAAAPARLALPESALEEFRNRFRAAAAGPPVLLPPAVSAVPRVRVAAMEPLLDRSRPWWRPRWHWTVVTAPAIYGGHTWTHRGAHRRTARQARRCLR